MAGLGGHLHSSCGLVRDDHESDSTQIAGNVVGSGLADHDVDRDGYLS